MYISYIIRIISFTSVIAAFSFPTDPNRLVTSAKRSISSIFTRQTACPAVWKNISSELSTMFAGTLALSCTDDALAAIRAGFHDCFPGDGGCDGSLILANEYSRTENNGLADISQKLAALASKYGVGTADMISFAASHAIVTCPLGPITQTFIGRTDSTTAAPEGALPDHTESAEAILAKFTAKGFSALDLVALLGAHSTAKQFFVDPARAGASFDATPGQWDVTYYGQVVTDTAEFQLDSDKRISEDAGMAPFFDLFTVDQVGWTVAFTPAWEKLQLLGVEGGSSNPDLIDCTSALPIIPAVGARVQRNSGPAPHSMFRRWWG